MKSFDSVASVCQKQLNALLELDSFGAGPVSKQILELFMESVPIQLRELGTHLQTQDEKKARYIAHNLRSSVGNVGAMKLMAMLGEIEEAIRSDLEIEKKKALELELFGVATGELDSVIDTLKRTPSISMKFQ
jgi:HPt (histidine-containing phosphotransfer) domain-containing protein